MKIVINRIPPSLNKFTGRKNVWEYRELKKEWKDLIVAVARPRLRIPYAKALVKIEYFFPKRNRHDADNYSGKMILDGLTVAGVIIDDDFAHISLECHGNYDKINPRTEITIIPIEENEIEKN